MMSCLNQPLRTGIVFLTLVLPCVCAGETPSLEANTTKTVSAHRTPDLTFPSGLQLAVSADNLLLLTKNGQTIQLSYTQTLALLTELVSSNLLDKTVADKTETLLNRLLNEQSDTLSSTEIMGLDKPLSLVKARYKGPILQHSGNKPDTDIPLDLSAHIANDQPIIKTEASELPPSELPLESPIVRHNPVIEDQPQEEHSSPSVLSVDTSTEESFDDFDIPDGINEDRTTEIPTETGYKEKPTPTRRTAAKPQ